MIGWVGNVFIVVGLFLVGRKDRRAFLFSIAGETAWIVNAALRHDWALVTICAVFNLMAFRNYLLWGKTTDGD